MIRAFALIACLIPATVFAQSNSEPPAVMEPDITWCMGNT